MFDLPSVKHRARLGEERGQTHAVTSTTGATRLCNSPGHGLHGFRAWSCSGWSLIEAVSRQ
jgi:hypothetical protein